VDAFVYLLRCADGSLYCGWTTDLGRRVSAHRRGTGARYTTPRRPVELAAAWRAPDRSAAMRLEAQIKRLPRPRKDALVAGAPLAGARRVAQKAVASANG
jgi:putative endonuclease